MASVTKTFKIEGIHNVTSSFTWRWNDDVYGCTISGVSTGRTTLSFNISAIPQGATITGGSISYQYGSEESVQCSAGISVTVAKSVQINTSSYPSCVSKNIVDYFKNATKFTTFPVRLSGAVKPKTAYDSYYEGSDSATGHFGTVTLTLTYTEPENATVSYGNNGSWKKCKIYYGHNGAWVPVKAKYGYNGTWKDVK